VAGEVVYNGDMLIMSLFSWWYSGGLKKELAHLGDSMSRSLDFFSIGLLLKTLFAPFRQIDSGSADNAPMDVRMRMFFDQLMSRAIGGFMRTLVILVGLVVLAAKLVFSLVVVVLYLLLPLLPVVGTAMFIIGWIPKWPV
jgi:hypothetical protein